MRPALVVVKVEATDPLAPLTVPQRRALEALGREPNGGTTDGTKEISLVACRDLARLGFVTLYDRGSCRVDGGGQRWRWQAWITSAGRARVR